MKNSEIMVKTFVYLDSLVADDEFQLLILPKAECDLLTYMELSYNEFFLEEENKDKDK